MAAIILKGLLGSLLGDALRLVGGVATGLAICLLLVVHLVPALLLAAIAPGGPGTPATPGAPPPPPADLADIFAEVEGRTGIPASLLTALASVESGFDPRAVVLSAAIAFAVIATIGISFHAAFLRISRVAA